MRKTAEYYRALYAMQDEVLDTVFAEECGFCLTGGTAFSRFYFELRYSDDLDFFHPGNRFSYGVERKQVLERLADRSDFEFEARTEGIEFSSYRLSSPKFVDPNTDERIVLRVDFVNDRTHWAGKPCVVFGRQIDSLENVLANKITTVVSRDEPKDVADLMVGLGLSDLSFSELWDEADKKACMDAATFHYRLKTFPVDALSRVVYVNPRTEAVLKELYPTFREAVLTEDLTRFRETFRERWERVQKETGLSETRSKVRTHTNVLGVER